ncbi:MAG: hypothetical protein R2712_02665 [Vicinamibacterales bacterium]
MVGALESGITGAQLGFAPGRRRGRIARDTDGAGAVGNTVDLLRARQEVRANLAVVRTADELVGRLIDTFARSIRSERGDRPSPRRGGRCPRLHCSDGRMRCPGEAA